MPLNPPCTGRRTSGTESSILAHDPGFLFGHHDSRTIADGRRSGDAVFRHPPLPGAARVEVRRAGRRWARTNIPAVHDDLGRDPQAPRLSGRLDRSPADGVPDAGTLAGGRLGRRARLAVDSAAQDSPEELYALWRAAAARCRAAVDEVLADGGLDRPSQSPSTRNTYPTRGDCSSTCTTSTPGTPATPTCFGRPSTAWWARIRRSCPAVVAGGRASRCESNDPLRSEERNDSGNGSDGKSRFGGRPRAAGA